MQSLYLEGDNQLPIVFLDKKSGKFEISGNSNHKYTVDYFKPVLYWLDEYVQDPLDETVFDFKLESYNTSSAVHFFKIITKLQQLKKNNFKVKINWYYKDVYSDIKSAGIHFKELFKLDIQLIKQD